MATGSILTIEPDFSRQPPHVLLLSDDEAWIHELRERLAPYPLDTRAATPEIVEREALRAWKPEAVIMNAGAKYDLAEVIAELRREGFTREYPIIVMGAGVADPEWRLGALRAGAWDCIGPVETGEAIALKIRAFLGSTRTAATARQRALVDETSGLYNLQGILRWARELSNTARRYSRPFGCAIFAPVSDQPEEPEDQSRKIALHLTRLGRGSDIVGRLSTSEYIVLAPDADPAGIIEMAQRFVRESADETTASIQLRAGCSAVSNLAMEMVEPAEMIAYATLALGRARTPGSNVVEFFVGGSRSDAN